MQNDLTWRGHLELGEKPMIPTIRRKLGGLKLLGKQIPKKGCLTLVNGLILSKITYLIQVWGGTHENNLRKVQTVLNSAARFVLNVGKKTKMITLMEGCKWLFVNELVKYHSLITLWKMIRMRKPKLLSEKITVVEEDHIRITPSRLQITSANFKGRTTNQWNNLPTEIRLIKTLPKFKKVLKKWIIEQRNPNEFDLSNED